MNETYRPLAPLSVSTINLMFDEGKNDVDLLRAILHELLLRETKEATLLAGRVLQHLEDRHKVELTCDDQIKPPPWHYVLWT